MPSTRSRRVAKLPSRSDSSLECPRLLTRKVGKSGAVCISELVPGTHVRVVQASPGVYVVSPLPEQDVRRIVEQMPRPPQSPYSALIASVAERRRPASPSRARRAFTGIVEEPAESDEAVLARARLKKPKRPPR